MTCCILSAKTTHDEGYFAILDAKYARIIKAISQMHHIPLMPNWDCSRTMPFLFSSSNEYSKHSVNYPLSLF